MKTVLFMRHAKSSWDHPGLADHDRPLNKRGVSAARKMGDFLDDLEILPDVIISSTSERTRETIKFFLQTSSFSGNIYYSRILYHGGTEEIIEAIKEFIDDSDCVMILGHNPGTEDAIEDFTGEYIRMPTAAIAQVDFDIQRWEDFDDKCEGELVNVWRPKEID